MHQVCSEHLSLAWALSVAYRISAMESVRDLGFGLETVKVELALLLLPICSVDDLNSRRWGCEQLGGEWLQ